MLPRNIYNWVLDMPAQIKHAVEPSYFPRAFWRCVKHSKAKDRQTKHHPHPLPHLRSDVGLTLLIFIELMANCTEFLRRLQVNHIRWCMSVLHRADHFKFTAFSQTKLATIHCCPRRTLALWNYNIESRPNCCLKILWKWHNTCLR